MHCQVVKFYNVANVCKDDLTIATPRLGFLRFLECPHSEAPQIHKIMLLQKIYMYI